MKRKSKEIFEYLVRFFLFLLLNRQFIYHIDVFLLSYFATFFPEGDGVILIAAFVFLMHYYLSIKICGLFKKLDNLNIFLSLIIVIFIDILFNVLNLRIIVQIFPLRFSYDANKGLFSVVIFCFVLYKFFNFLSKKFILFQKIGYYSSIEFWKDLINKIKIKVLK